MNYSTIKKVVAYSMLSVLGLASASAQTTTSSAKVFGGNKQYRNWSIGINGGVVSPTLIYGGSNDFNSKDLGLGYGLSVRKMVNHSFGFLGAIERGTIKGHNEFEGTAANVALAFNNKGASRFYTELNAAGSISAFTQFGNIDFLHRENSINFFLHAGLGLSYYAPFVSTQVTNGVAISDADIKKASDAANLQYGSKKDHDNIHELFVPVGLGVEFKLSDRIALNLGYKVNFLDGDNLDNFPAKFTTKDHWSYGYAGLEFSLGDGSKPNMDWINPVALMYDELKDPTLRQEVEALKGRVSTLENTVNQLSADADGDGVSNKFDKCPNTPAGSVVDGSGCPIKFPTPAPMTMTPTMGYYNPIMFEFDSSVLKTSSYPVLDQLSADLRGNMGSSIMLNGFASSEGTDEYNMRLSTDRANSVKSYLVNSGVDASRVMTKGMGESMPVASNSTEEGRIQNRRVEIKK